MSHTYPPFKPKTTFSIPTPAISPQSSIPMSVIDSSRSPTSFPLMETVLREHSVGIKVIDAHDDEVLCLDHLNDDSASKDNLPANSRKIKQKLKKTTSIEDIPVLTIDTMERQRSGNQCCGRRNQMVEEWLGLKSEKRCSKCRKKETLDSDANLSGNSTKPDSCLWCDEETGSCTHQSHSNKEHGTYQDKAFVCDSSTQFDSSVSSRLRSNVTIPKSKLNDPIDPLPPRHHEGSRSGSPDKASCRSNITTSDCSCGNCKNSGDVSTSVFTSSDETTNTDKGLIKIDPEIVKEITENITLYFIEAYKKQYAESDNQKKDSKNLEYLADEVKLNGESLMPSEEDEDKTSHGVCSVTSSSSQIEKSDSPKTQSDSSRPTSKGKSCASSQANPRETELDRSAVFRLDIPPKPIKPVVSLSKSTYIQEPVSPKRKVLVESDDTSQEDGKLEPNQNRKKEICARRKPLQPKRIVASTAVKTLTSSKSVNCECEYLKEKEMMKREDLRKLRKSVYAIPLKSTQELYSVAKESVETSDDGFDLTSEDFIEKFFSDNKTY